MSKLLGFSLPDKLDGSAPKFLNSFAVGLGELGDRELNGSPECSPKAIEVRGVQAAVKSVAGIAKAGIQACLKGGMKVQMLLLPVAVLGFDRLPPKRLLPLGLRIALFGLGGSGKFPRQSNNTRTGLLQVRMQGSRLARNPSGVRQSTISSCTKIVPRTGVSS